MTTALLQKVRPHSNTNNNASSAAASSSSTGPALPYADELPLVAISTTDRPLRTGPSPDPFLAPRAFESAPIMDQPTSNHTRRRSSSLASLLSNNAPSGSKRHSKKHRRPAAPGDIIEADEDKQALDDDSGDSTDRSGSSDYEMDPIDSDSGVEDDEETGLTGRERQKRRKRKRRNTRLDERVAGGVQITQEEERAARREVVRSSLINVTLILLWYLFSIAISLYNKWMFKEDGEDGAKHNVFPFPLFTTSLHQLVQFTLASLVMFAFPQFRPTPDSVGPHHAHGEPPRQEVSDPKKPLITKWFYLTRLGPCGIATGFDIGLGNMSLRFISLTFFTMCKSSALGFVLIFAFLFQLEKPSWRLVGIIGTMTVGVIMMVAGETAFNALGFILVMASSCSSGFRWSLTQILLLRHPATSNPFSTIMFLAPIIFISLTIIAIPVEGLPHLIVGLHDLMEARGTVMGILILLFPGLLAFLMMSSEFALLKRTSVVTLSICGIFKEVAMVIAASVVFDDKLTPINVSGLVITICSIGAYNYIKIRKMQEEARQKVHLAHEDYAPILAAEPEEPRGESEPTRASGSLLRNKLNISIGSSSQAGSGVDGSSRNSPVKRPEDVE